MIEYFYETDFKLSRPKKHTGWIIDAANQKGHAVEALNYIFCSDDYLLNINRQFLQHDDLTDIITFPGEGSSGLKGDIFISIDRVRENAGLYSTPFEEELRRVMIHGALHLMGHEDTTSQEKEAMRAEEDALMKLFHVKHS